MTRTNGFRKPALVLITAFVVAACGGGGGGGGNGGNNNTPVAPVANAGADQDVNELSTVTLMGSGTDGNGDTLSYQWAQTAGTAVTIMNQNGAQATFTAPDVTAGNPETLTFELTVTDPGGLADTDTVDITVSEPVPTAPVADAGADQNAQELTTVTLAGSGTDVNNDPLTFMWTQTAGPNVTINNANMATATFTAPDVNADTLLTFELMVSDPGGLSDTDSVDITVSEANPFVTISGVVRYQFPPPNANCLGLAFGISQFRPIRQATVQLVNAANDQVLDTTTSDDTGSYSFQADPNTSVYVRVRAEMIQAGNPGWNVQIRDNTANTNGNPALPQRALYVLEDAASNPNGADQLNRNLTGAHGWTGTEFGLARTAAPFAILDATYSAMQLVLSVDSDANFPPLDIYWSVNNTDVAGNPFDIDTGDLGGAFYNGIGIFLRGMDGVNIDEFDDHVIVHEWGHYFEDNFSRSDSIGGGHGINDILDARLAFGEGFATALSGMALDNNLYCDISFNAGGLTGFDLRIESEPTNAFRGWFNEASIFKIMYDYWDTANDGADNSSIGFQPMYDVLTNEQVSTPGWTTIFTFASALKQQGTGQNAFIDAVLDAEGVTSNGIDDWGSTETNDANATVVNPLPVYQDITPNGSTLNVCSSGEFDTIGPQADGNKLTQHRYLRMVVTNAGTYNVNVAADAATLAAIPGDQGNLRGDTDPDIFIGLNGQVVAQGTSYTPGGNTETFSTTLQPGTYRIAFEDWRYSDTEAVLTYPIQTCFDITIGP